MKSVLILGGTQFIGRNLVERLLASGEWDITLFNRQRTQPDLFPQVKRIKGDRETADVEQLGNAHWDCVIDLSCYYPDSLQSLLSVLQGRVKRFVFVSTLSVFRLDEHTAEGLDEALETMPCDSAQRSDRSVMTYGNRKAECERVLQQIDWLDKVILRPSLVYGRYDHTDRFYYWLYRAHRKLPIHLPDNGADKITLTYVGDLVESIVKAMTVRKHSTLYHVTTHEPLSLSALVDAIDRTAEKVAVDSTKLMSNGVMPGQNIPLWFNTSFIVSNDKIKKEWSLPFTPLDASIAETARYYEALGWPAPKVGRETIMTDLPE